MDVWSAFPNVRPPGPPAPDAGQLDAAPETTWYHGVWLWSGSSWVMTQSTGPQPMSFDAAMSLAERDPYTTVFPPPYAWSGAWSWDGLAWKLEASHQNW